VAALWNAMAVEEMTMSTTMEREATQDQVIEQYPKKYLLARIGFARPSRAKLDSGQIIVIRISPARDLPAGFASEPGTRAPTLEEATKK